VPEHLSAAIALVLLTAIAVVGYSISLWGGGDESAPPYVGPDFEPARELGKPRSKRGGRRVLPACLPNLYALQVPVGGR